MTLKEKNTRERKNPLIAWGLDQYKINIAGTMKLWNGFIIKKLQHNPISTAKISRKFLFVWAVRFFFCLQTAKFRTFHDWRISNEWLVKYLPFWLPLDIKKLLTSDSVITHQKFRSSGRHVTQISTWQGMLLARLAAEKQEVTCKTLLKLENNSLKGVWSTIRYSESTREKHHAWAEGNLREPGKEMNQRKCYLIIANTKGHCQIPDGPFITIATRVSNVPQSCKYIQEEVPALYICWQFTLRAKAVLRIIPTNVLTHLQLRVQIPS